MALTVSYADTDTAAAPCHYGDFLPTVLSGVWRPWGLSVKEEISQEKAKSGLLFLIQPCSLAPWVL